MPKASVIATGRPLLSFVNVAAVPSRRFCDVRFPFASYVNDSTTLPSGAVVVVGSFRALNAYVHFSFFGVVREMMFPATSYVRVSTRPSGDVVFVTRPSASYA